jgi:hypothetical protein
MASVLLLVTLLLVSWENCEMRRAVEINLNILLEEISSSRASI